MTKKNAQHGSLAWANQVLDATRDGLPTSRCDVERALYLTGDLTAHDDAFSPLVSELMRGLSGDFERQA